MIRKAALIVLCGGYLFCMGGCKDNADPTPLNDPNALTIAGIPTPEFTQRVEALRAQGYPVSLDDLEARYKLPEGVENAADVYIEAFEYYQEPTEAESENLPISGNYYKPDKNPPYPTVCMEAMKSFLTRNQTTLELLDKAARMEHCMLPRTRYEVHIRTDHRVRVLEGAILVNVRNIYLAQCQQTEALSQSLKTSLALTKALALQPFLLDYLTSCSINSGTAYFFEHAIGVTTLDEGQLVALQSDMAQIQEQEKSLLYSALINNRVFMIERYQLPVEKLVEAVPEGTVERYKEEIKQYHQTGLYWEDAVAELDFMQECILGLHRPTWKRLLELKKTREDINRSPGFRWVISSIGITVDIMTLRLREIGALRCAEASLAVERYRLRHETLPASLEELVPEFMASVPLDPFDGKPLRYKLRDTEGYLLYTIGEDGIDNGGLTREQANKMTEKYPPEEFDYVFTVTR